MQQSQAHSSIAATSFHVVHNLIDWIIAADRRFRATQRQINRFGNRF